MFQMERTVNYGAKGKNIQKWDFCLRFQKNKQETIQNKIFIFQLKFKTTSNEVLIGGEMRDEKERERERK